MLICAALTSSAIPKILVRYGYETHRGFISLKRNLDFLLILGGVSCFVSSGITLLVSDSQFVNLRHGRRALQQVFFPRSLITELGYTITSPAVTGVKTPVSPSTEFRHVPVHYPECAVVAKHSLHPTPSSSVDSHQDASPDYEPEDPSNPPRPHSYDGHVRMRVWDPHRAEASGANRSSAPYLFDERLKGLVGSHSDSPGLHPYVSTVIHFVGSFFFYKKNVISRRSEVLNRRSVSCGDGCDAMLLC